MLLLAAIAALQASQPPRMPPGVGVRAQISIRILQSARVEDGRTKEPHSRGKARVMETDGVRRTIDLVEFQ